MESTTNAGDLKVSKLSLKTAAGISIWRESTRNGAPAFTKSNIRAYIEAPAMEIIGQNFTGTIQTLELIIVLARPLVWMMATARVVSRPLYPQSIFGAIC